MSTILIENLGPIDGRFEMSLDKKLTILIGEQATGKSTIARVAYYCATCRIDWMLDSNIYRDDIIGMHVSNMQQYFIKNYGKGNGEVRFTDTDIEFIFGAGTDFEVPKPNIDKEFVDSSAIFIPAGRSTIPLLFESYLAAKKINVDPFFDFFLVFLDGKRKEYRRSINDLLTKATGNSSAPIDLSNAKIVVTLLEEILKGEYYYEQGEEWIKCRNGSSVRLNVASSGQQEILFILMALFHVLCEMKPYTIIIEEPEAHIFPRAQKLFMELLARVINATGSNVIVTTHSPYILTASNLLIHSAKVENMINNDNPVVQPMARLKPSDVSAYMLERNGEFTYRSIIDNETGLISAEEIDVVSEDIERGMSNLVDMEVKYGL
jgi:predicted ATPase